MENPDVLESAHKISYKFIFKDGSEKTFDLLLDPLHLNLLKTDEAPPPEWAKLETFRCPNCPLKAEEHLYCPIAINLRDVIEVFTNVLSYEQSYISVETEERTYSKTTSVQVGVSSLIGILMVTSGCPIMGKLKPMVRFHLPFATPIESEFRSFSMYLLAQYFRKQKGLTPDWDMVYMKKIYRDIHVLNHNISKQIADIEDKDTSINSVVVLNTFADSITFSLVEEDLEHLEVLFRDFFY